MKTLILILASFSLAVGQMNLEEYKVTGTVISINSGYGFALDNVDLKVQQDTWRFVIDPIYGKSVLSKIRLGETISIKVLTNPILKPAVDRKKLVSNSTLLTLGTTCEVKVGNEWIKTPTSQNGFLASTSANRFIFLDQKVLSEYHHKGLKKGLVFENGKIAFSKDPIHDRVSMENLSRGNVVSFAGFRSPVMDGYVYPINGVKDVYSFIPLNKIEGPITSFTYKEDFARVGLVVKDKRLTFPSEYALKIESFANGEKVSAYFREGDKRFNRKPSLYALVQNRDTIFISYPYIYPDKHEYKSAEFSGKVSKKTYSDKGRLINITIDSDYFVEVDTEMAEQLGPLLKEGTQLKISGEERIKMDGEIYEKNYHIIIPKKIMIDGKEFIL